MQSFKNLDCKKKRLAPLVNNNVSESVETASSVGIISGAVEVADVDLLQQIFGDCEPSDSKPDCEGFVDLDDWGPPKPAQSAVVTKANLSKPGTATLSKEGLSTKQNASDQNILKGSVPNTSFLQKKQMLFNSREYDEDSTLRLRFLKREIPASKLKDMKDSMEYIELSAVTKFAGKGTWFTSGVVVECGNLQTGSGSKLDVTDLAAEPFSIRVLLFGEAHLKHSKKIPVGSIVCILSPTKGKPFKGQEAIVVNSDTQLIIAGTSRDFGLCGATKKGGGMCRFVVNMNICRFCRYHSVKEYKNKQMGKDLKAAANGVGLGLKKNAVGVWNAPADRAQFLMPAKQNCSILKKDKDRLFKLNSLSSSPGGKNNLVALTNENSNKRKGLSTSPENGVKRIALSPDLPNRSDGHSIKSPIGFCHPSSTTKMSPSPMPLLVTPPMQPIKRMSVAKKKALEFAKSNGGVFLPKPKPEIEPITKKTDKEDVKTKGITPEFLAMMAEGSSNPALLAEAEAEERDKRFDRLSVIEEVSEKLCKTHEVPTRAVRCLECSKTYFQLPIMCVNKQHPSRVVMTTKRFFQCTGCKGRTTTLERFPAIECGTCRAWSWKRAGMTAEKLCTTTVPLSVRGLEETFIGSAAGGGNLSMLVPEDQVS